MLFSLSPDSKLHTRVNEKRDRERHGVVWVETIFCISPLPLLPSPKAGGQAPDAGMEGWEAGGWDRRPEAGGQAPDAGMEGREAAGRDRRPEAGGRDSSLPRSFWVVRSFYDFFAFLELIWFCMDDFESVASPVPVQPHVCDCNLDSCSSSTLWSGVIVSPNISAIFVLSARSSGFILYRVLVTSVRLHFGSLGK